MNDAELNPQQCYYELMECSREVKRLRERCTQSDTAVTHACEQVNRAVDENTILEAQNIQMWDALQFIKNAECIETSRAVARRVLEDNPQ